MKQSAERLAYRAAVATRNWAEAARIVREHPDIFGRPPPGVPDEIACVANDPMEPGWMIVEWRVQKNDCKGVPSCKPYLLNAVQFDHLSASTFVAEVAAWFEGYMQRRREAGPCKDQLGQTLYLLKVERIVPITDFEGELING